jgi:hypothetical protein
MARSTGRGIGGSMLIAPMGISMVNQSLDEMIVVNGDRFYNKSSFESV